jgi:hypothetical protein
MERPAHGKFYWHTREKSSDFSARSLKESRFGESNGDHKIL